MNNIIPIETDYETEDGNSIFYNGRTDTFSIESEQPVLQAIKEGELGERMDRKDFEEMLKKYG